MEAGGHAKHKDMHDEDGNRAFMFPGKVPGYEDYFPDVDASIPLIFGIWTRRLTT